MTTHALPPLPEPLKEVAVAGYHDGTLRPAMEEYFDADQMRAYAIAALSALPAAGIPARTIAVRHPLQSDEAFQREQDYAAGWNGCRNFVLAMSATTPQPSAALPVKTSMFADGVRAAYEKEADPNVQRCPKCRFTIMSGIGYCMKCGEVFEPAPQPSAAEDSQDEVDALHVEWNHLPLRDAYMVSRFLDKAMALIRRLAAATPPPDAAVGAQGDGCDHCGRHVFVVHGSDAHCNYCGRVTDRYKSAAPAAGKGVDAFKAYVHQRLDAMGVPHSVPESEHDKAGCRVGGRLDFVEAALTRQPVAGDGWREACNELECCDDVPLQDGLAAGIRCLREQRDHARASMNDARNKLRDRAAELRASGMKFGLRSLHEAADSLIELRKGLPNTEPAPAATPTDGGEGKS